MVQFILAMAALLKAVAWPAAAVCVAVLFKSELRSLLPRIRKAGPTGVELDPIQQQNIGKADLSTSPVKQFPGLTRTQAVDDLERVIRQNLTTVPDNDRIDRVVVELAQARLVAHFERVYRGIFGSQILALRRLNDRATGASIEDARVFFDEQAAPHKDVYEGYGFDGWISFLLNEILILQQGGRLQISPVGKDFLIYLTLKGMTDQKPY